MKNIWTVIKKPIRSVIGMLPGGSMINSGIDSVSGLVNRFKRK